MVEVQPPKFRDVQKLIANKLEHFKVKEAAKEGAFAKMRPPTLKPATEAVEIQPNGLMNGPPPPPPPPLPRKAAAKAATMQKAPALVQFYHSLTKHDGKKGAMRNGNSSSPAVVNPHSSIVGEIQNRSAHLLAVSSWGLYLLV